MPDERDDDDNVSDHKEVEDADAEGVELVAPTEPAPGPAKNYRASMSMGAKKRFVDANRPPEDERFLKTLRKLDKKFDDEGELASAIERANLKYKFYDPRWIWCVLTHPHPDLQEAVYRRRSRVLAIVCLVMVTLTIPGLYLSWSIDYSGQFIITACFLGCFLLTYILTRSSYFRYGAILGALCFVAIPYVFLISYPRANPSAILKLTSLGVMMSTSIMTVQAMILTIVCNIGCHFLVLLLSDRYTLSLIAPALWFQIVIGIVLIFCSLMVVRVDREQMFSLAELEEEMAENEDDDTVGFLWNDKRIVSALKQAGEEQGIKKFFVLLFHPSEEIHDSVMRRRARALTGVLFLCAPALTILGIERLANNGSGGQNVVLLVGGIIMFFLYGLSRTSHYQLTGALFAEVAALVPMLWVVLSPERTYRANDFQWVVISVVFGSFTLRPTLQISILVLNFIILVVLCALFQGRLGPADYLVSDISFYGFIATVVLLSTLVTAADMKHIERKSQSQRISRVSKIIPGREQSRSRKSSRKKSGMDTDEAAAGGRKQSARKQTLNSKGRTSLEEPNPGPQQDQASL